MRDATGHRSKYSLLFTLWLGIFLFVTAAGAPVRLAVAATEQAGRQVAAKKTASQKAAPNKKMASGKAMSRKTAAASTATSKKVAAQKQRAQKQVARKTGKKTRLARKTAAKKPSSAPAPVRLSYAERAGLHKTRDALNLKSNVAFVMDQDTHEVLFRKNADAVLPIASITKLMTAIIVVEGRQSLNEEVTITADDVDTLKNSSSRLRVGVTLTRGELLHLALMSSENRAAHALGRTYPGGIDRFVENMNSRARLLGMLETHFVDPTGLSSRNQSSARDLAVLVNAAHQYPLLRRFSTSPSYAVDTGRQTLQYNNTNALVKNDHWDIGLQKTGYISEAGRCLVMQTQVGPRNVIMVFLDSEGKRARTEDAIRVRDWMLEEEAEAPSQQRVVMGAQDSSIH